MAGNLTLKLGTPAQLSVTLTSLAASANGVAGRASTAVDNTTTLAMDDLLRVVVKTGSGTIAGNKGWWIYVYGGENGSGSWLYDDGIGGTDAAFTRTDPANLALAQFLNTPAAATPYSSRLISVASLFGGTLPPKWGVFIANDTNITGDASVGAAYHTPVFGQYT